MTIAIERPGLVVHQGDALAVLRTLGSESVHAICTSPPYFSLRSYLDKDHPDKALELGTERTPAEYVARLVEILREARRVLRADGLAFVNIADSYAGSWGNYAPGGIKGEQRARTLEGARWDRPAYGDTTIRPATTNAGIPAKSLCLVPERLAIALQDDGWIVRSKIRWCKVACMPESVADRPTSAVEEILMLAKSGAPTFWTHPERPGVRKAPAPDYRWRNKQTGEVMCVDPQDTAHWQRFNLWAAWDYFYDAAAVAESTTGHEQGTRGVGEWNKLPSEQRNGRDGSTLHRKETTRNMRNYWLLSPAPFSAARLGVVGAEHYAAYPPELVRRVLACSTSDKGCCAACLAPWARVVERQTNWQERKAGGAWAGNVGVSDTYQNAVHSKGHSHDLGSVQVTERGWAPTCACADPRPPVPATVLDPFFGSGTTGKVATAVGRACVGIELNVAYIPILAARNAQAGMGFFDDEGAAS